MASPTTALGLAHRSSLPAAPTFLRDSFWEWQANEPRRRLQRREWFYLFLFCQIECGFVLGTSYARRGWFGLAVCDEKTVHTTPRPWVQSWDLGLGLHLGWLTCQTCPPASGYGDGNTKPDFAKNHATNLVILWWQSSFWLVFFLKNKAIRINKIHRKLKDTK